MKFEVSATLDLGHSIESCRIGIDGDSSSKWHVEYVTDRDGNDHPVELISDGVYEEIGQEVTEYYSTLGHTI